jgi:hypothetical protein
MQTKTQQSKSFILNGLIHPGFSYTVAIPLQSILIGWKYIQKYKTTLKKSVYQCMFKCCGEGTVDIYVDVFVSLDSVIQVIINVWHADRIKKKSIGQFVYDINKIISDSV